MEVIETDHAYLTAYETLQIVKTRIAESNPKTKNDPRSKDIFGDLPRVYAAREMLLTSLQENSPEGSLESDSYRSNIIDFTREIQEINSNISPDQIRSLIAIRPQNASELSTIFSTEETWSQVASECDTIFELIHKYLFPKSDN